MSGNLQSEVNTRCIGGLRPDEILFAARLPERPGKCSELADALESFVRV